MIELSNGHKLDFVVASGALGWDGQGWQWEKPLVKLGLIDPKLFTVVTKTLTPYGRIGKYYIMPFPGGVWNYMGLPNKGIQWWIHTYLHKLDKDQPLILSIAPDDPFMREYLWSRWINEIKKVNCIKGIEINVSCPNIKYYEKFDLLEIYEEYKRFELPLILKIRYGQYFGQEFTKDHLKLFEAISLNSVPVSKGAISGKVIQEYNWPIMKALHSLGFKVIASSIWNYDDIQKVKDIGCSAISFGSIHLLRPWAPTSYVRRFNNV